MSDNAIFTKDWEPRNFLLHLLIRAFLNKLIHQNQTELSNIAVDSVEFFH